MRVPHKNADASPLPSLAAGALGSTAIAVATGVRYGAEDGLMFGLLSAATCSIVGIFSLRRGYTEGVVDTHDSVLDNLKSLAEHAGDPDYIAGQFDVEPESMKEQCDLAYRLLDDVHTAFKDAVPSSYTNPVRQRRNGRWFMRS